MLQIKVKARPLEVPPLAHRQRPAQHGQHGQHARTARTARMDGALCLATILDTSRLSRVVRLAEVWPGPISAAVLAAPGTDLFAERGLVQAALALMRKPQRLRVTLVENTG